MAIAFYKLLTFKREGLLILEKLKRSREGFFFLVEKNWETLGWKWV